MRQFLHRGELTPFFHKHFGDVAEDDSTVFSDFSAGDGVGFAVIVVVAPGGYWAVQLGDKVDVFFSGGDVGASGGDGEVVGVVV